MKHLNYLLWILFAGVILSSCTITKRHFGNGYHIEWKRKHHESVPEPDALKEISQQNDMGESIGLVEQGQKAEEPVETQAQETKSVSEANNSLAALQTDKAVFQEQDIATEIKDEQVKPAENPERVNKREEKEGKIHPLTWVLISILALGVMSMGLMIANIFFVFGVVGFAFIGMILGIIALVSVNRHPEKYRKKGLTRFFAIFLIAAGGAITVFTILILVLSYFYY